MKTIEPRRIAVADTLFWLKEALELISRRLLVFIGSVTLFVVSVYVAIRAVVPLIPESPSLLILSIFLIFCAFSLFVILTDLIVLAFLSDNSLAADPGERLRTVLPEQKKLLRLALMALLVGASIWVTFLYVHPSRDLYQACDKVLSSILLDKDNPISFIFKLTATVLYFLILALVGLRTFFSIPLIVFHDLNYVEAQALSQRAIYINIQAISMALVTWILMFMVSMSVVPIASAVLFPLFGAYVYVAYRHVFLGQKENKPAKELSKKVALESAVYTDR
ncbi:MAG: hypothetical protein OEZ43_13270 [Gammaproteobacteria bacterium]|nr:hypothetical protein [Gammaproteobacteria bacterium]